MLVLLGVLVALVLAGEIFIMATLAEVQAAQAAEAQAIVDLTARIAALPQPAATATDLDGVKAVADANTIALNALVV